MKAWIDERGADRKLTVITQETFYVDSDDKTDFKAAVESLEAGASPESVLSGKAVRIPLHTIYRVESEEADTDITLNYKEGKDKKSDFYFYSTAAVRDEIVAELKNVLGESFDSYTDAYNVPRAVYGSLMTITITVLVSWILSGAARSIQAAESVDVSGKNGFLKRLLVGALDMLGPTGVMVLGWIVVILAAMNFYKRASNPPVMTIIQAQPYRGGTMTATTVKYLLLAGLVFITARAVMS